MHFRSSLRDTIRAFRHRSDWFKVAGWPLLGLGLAGLLLATTSDRISTARNEADFAARRDAVTIANSYAQQLGHMVEQIDQITLRLKYQWEDPDIQVSLEKEHSVGLFPASQLLYASIFDAAGNIISSTIPRPHPKTPNTQSYIQFHKENCCAGLLISPPSPSRITGRPIVRFTRRLDRPDGGFDGVAIVAVEPPYLITFQEGAAPRPRDFVTVRLETGAFIASRVGSNGEKVRVFYKQDPVFSARSGIRIEQGDRFHDGVPRYLAWKKLNKYPLVALVGLSAADALAPFEAEAASLQKTAYLQSAAILAATLIAAYMTYTWTRRRRQIEETQETYRVATDAANEGFYMIRPIYDAQGTMVDFRIEDCNNRAAAFIYAKREQLVGMKGSQIGSEHFKNDILALSRIALEKGFLEDELRVPRDSPIEAEWIYRRIVPARAGLALTIRDISEVKAQERALADLAHNDMLTKLPNRHWMTGFLPNAIAHAVGRNGHLAVLFIDLDNFKNINDTMGHEAGDDLLVQAARRLKSALRASDHVVRLGGDEFVVILEHIHVEEDVARAANAITNAISKPFELAAGTGNHVNASIGISVFPQDGADAETLLKHADIAMYAAKAAGKGRYAFYHAHLSDSLILRLNKESALRNAVENNEFIVHYQPRVATQTGRLTSMEALVRWERPGHGIIYPSEFIDTAEDMGLIVRIGEYVIEQVCGQLAQWREQGLHMVPVSVNVSPQQLKSGTLSGYVAACIERHGIEPRYIEAELTESAVIDRSKVVTSEIAALRQLGIKIMIDDFGTGYSSMAQLHRLDVDVLKVDQEFTRALADGSDAKMLFRAIMSMAEALDICVVAEGVETIEQVNILHSLACDELQGYLISKAVNAAEMAQLMVKRILLSPSFGTPRLRPA